MNKLYALCLLAMVTLNVWAAETMDLYVGEIKIMKVSTVDRVAVGNAKLVGTSILNNGQLLLIGEAEGVTSLHIWFANGKERDMTVRVAKTTVENAKLDDALERSMAEVRALLHDVPGLKVRIVGSRIVLSGTVDKTYENSIATVKAAFKEVMDLTRKQEFLILPQNKMVHFAVRVTEFNKSASENLGINWVGGAGIAGAYTGAWEGGTRAATPVSTDDTAAAFDTTAIPPGTPGGFWGVAAEIAARINMAVTDGDAVILSEPRLVARSGGEAKVLVGGEIPYTVVNSVGSTSTEFKEFGISLIVKPQVDENDLIHASIETEVSAPGNAAPGDPPPISTRKTSTDVSMQSGETLVLSGLLDQQSTNAIDKVAFLADIPILGALFRSNSFSENRSELIIFMTPEVYETGSDRNQRYLSRQKEIAREYKDKVSDSTLEIID